ncbi:MAG TPA: glycoside hydrolase family 97 N-terminal domain-containing protein, partial [Bryobacteraceae bacterium]
MSIDRNRTMIAAAFFGAALSAAAQTTPVVLKSPNGALEMSIATVAARGGQVSSTGGQLAYRVTFQGKLLLDWSNLGVILQGAPALGAAVRVESAQPSSHDETWKSVQGKANPIRDHYNAAEVRTIDTGDTGRR